MLSELEITALVPDQQIRFAVNDNLSWTLTVRDLPTGIQNTITCTAAEVTAIMGLIVEGDDCALSTMFYAIAEPVMEKLCSGIDHITITDRKVLRVIP